jgi:SulP family sulfate permease
MTILPRWLTGYRRAWLLPDVIAGVIVWSVVVPQAVAYAQIAGLPPEAGLVAAPGALLGYALLGTSRTLVVSATTATSAVSAAAVGSLVQGDAARFAVLSAGLAVVSAAVLIVAGMLKLGRITDLVSKPVMTGFLFGLGLTVALGQLPKMFGIEGGSGTFFSELWDLLGELRETHVWTLAVGLASVALLVGIKRFRPAVPGTLVVLALGIIVSALLDLSSRGVETVGTLPVAVPHPAWPDIGWADVVGLLPAAFGILIMTAEAVGVARAIATSDGYVINPNRDLVAMGVSNLLAGLSRGFVQSGGASQTMAAENAGGKTQLTSLIAAALILVTGAFFGGLFRDLPQAVLAAVVIVAIAGFYRVDEIRRFAHLRRSAVLLSLIALSGVLLFGVLQGLLIAAGLSLILVIKKLSRPDVGTLVRDEATNAWGRASRHPSWNAMSGVIVADVEGPLFYANASSVKDRLLQLVRESASTPSVVVLGLAQSSELDVETLDMLDDLHAALTTLGIELRLASAHVPVLDLLRRSGLTERVGVYPTLDAAVGTAGTHVMDE